MIGAPLPQPLSQGERGFCSPRPLGEGLGVRYLIEDIPISYLSSGRDLPDYRRTSLDSDRAILIADPDFDRSTDTGAGQPQLGLGRRRLFDHRLDLVQVALSGHAPSPDGAIVR